MIKKFDIIANPILSSVVDSVETSLRCSKYNQIANRIKICLPDNVAFTVGKNRELAAKSFGACLIRSYDFDIWDVFIIIDMKNCTQATLTEREIAAVIFHELGHILNEPELQNEPTFEFCFIHGFQFSKELLEEVRISNCIAMEIFADSYANRHGYGQDLVSGFHKQNKTFEQQIEYCSTRVEKLQEKEYLEGKLMSSLNNNGR